MEEMMSLKVLVGKVLSITYALIQKSSLILHTKAISLSRISMSESLVVSSKLKNIGTCERRQDSKWLCCQMSLKPCHVYKSLPEPAPGQGWSSCLPATLFLSPWKFFLDPFSVTEVEHNFPSGNNTDSEKQGWVIPEAQTRVCFSKWHLSKKTKTKQTKKTPVIWQDNVIGILHINSPKQLDFRVISPISRHLSLACLFFTGIYQPSVPTTVT